MVQSNIWRAFRALGLGFDMRNKVYLFVLTGETGRKCPPTSLNAKYPSLELNAVFFVPLKVLSSISSMVSMAFLPLYPVMAANSPAPGSVDMKRPMIGFAFALASTAVSHVLKPAIPATVYRQITP
jgi:hypothetical protein